MSLEFSELQPIISVVIPIYNAGQYLDQALQSVQDQTFRDIEIICLNDGSTDDSLAIMDRHATEDPRIKVIDKANQGYGATCNRGMDEAQGTYIAILEPDDWIEPDMYQDMIRFADSFDQPVDIVKTPYWRIWMPDTDQQMKINCSFKGLVKPHVQPFALDDPKVAALLRHHPSIWSAIYKKDFLIGNGIRFREYPGSGWADNPFLVETLCQAKSIIYLDKPYYCYREETPEKEAAAVKKNPLMPLERWNEMQNCIDRIGGIPDCAQRAHNERGFVYLNETIEQVGLSDQNIYDAAVGMFKRMDTDLVMGDSSISPGNKELYLKMCDLPSRKISRFPYYFSMIGRSFTYLRNTGFSFTMATIKGYLSRSAKREGRA